MNYNACPKREIPIIYMCVNEICPLIFFNVECREWPKNVKTLLTRATDVNENMTVISNNIVAIYEMCIDYLKTEFT